MTYSQLYRTVRDRLSCAGIEAAAYEARCLLEELISIDRLRLISRGNDAVSDDEYNILISAAEKRADGYPLQYIIGKWSFMGREFLVGEGVLIPRDDTETAVMTCCEAVKELPSPRIIDLCSGSGIIAVTLSKLLKSADITALELSSTAFGYLERNTELNECKSITALKADIFKAYGDFEDGCFDAIISNPPYISRDVIPTLQKEVRHEPVSALDGGPDGLDFYRCIAKDWMPKLKPGGSVTLEIGEEQAQAVMELLSENGIGRIRVVKDIQGLDRVIFGTKKHS